MIKRFDQLEEGKLYKIYAPSFSRNDPGHWINWYYYTYNLTTPIFLTYFNNQLSDTYTGVLGKLSQTITKNSLLKQLFKELDLNEKLLIDVVLNDKFLIYDT